jgi:hypothetical protein
VIAAAITVLVALAVLPTGQVFLRDLGTQLQNFWYWLTGLF